MAPATVNLDALIHREDFSSDATTAGGRPRDTISLTDLRDDGFFHHSLRKPDFQRETTHWTPTAVFELIKAFLDGDLIPAVIMWERGNEYFIIDGAHRLSALISWIQDDYGDGVASSARFGSAISPEQKKIAERTRALIRKQIGSYSEFRGLVGQKIADPVKARWVKRLGGGAIDIQWVTAATPKAAEDSFFKINQSAQPIDPTERHILQTRNSPNAIAARCIARAGRGHKYWSAFAETKQEEIEALGDEIYQILYKPAVAKQPVTTADLPIAGQGYNALPFVFELVCISNDIGIALSKTAKKLPSAPSDDNDGSRTIEFLRRVRKRLELVSTNHPGSLGLHPLVYCYSSTGGFQANAFLATTEFALKLHKENRKKEFVAVRERFERYIVFNRQFVSLTMSRLGAGERSMSRIVDLYWQIFEGMSRGLSEKQIFDGLLEQAKFKHLRQLDVPPPSAELEKSVSGASNTSKSAAFIRAALESPTRCSECGASLHMNSVTFDHIVRVRDGGSNRSENLGPAHPYCNSGHKS